MGLSQTLSGSLLGWWIRPNLYRFCEMPVQGGSRKGAALCWKQQTGIRYTQLYHYCRCLSRRTATTLILNLHCLEPYLPRLRAHWEIACRLCFCRLAWKTHAAILFQLLGVSLKWKEWCFFKTYSHLCKAPDFSRSQWHLHSSCQGLFTEWLRTMGAGAVGRQLVASSDLCLVSCWRCRGNFS